MRFHITFFTSALLSVALSACGGSTSSPSALLPQAPNSAGNSITVPLTASESQVALPGAGGFSGSVTFPAVSTASSLVLSSSLDAPTGFALSAASARKPQSGTLSIFFYVTFTPSQTTQLPSLPSFTLVLPAGFAASNKQFYYGRSEQAPAGVQTQFLTQGPGTVNGQNVTFDSTATPLTLQQGRKYTFAFYAISTNNVAAEKLLYVTNAGTNSITAYPISAQGNAAPVRTILGANTGITHPVAITSDSDGNLIVANALPNGTTSVETFLDGASGNVAPVRRFSTAGTPAYIAVDPVDASVYVTLQSPTFYGVRVFTPTGTALRSLSFNPAQHAIVGIAIDKHDQLIVSGDLAGQTRFASVGDAFVFAPHSTDPNAPVYRIGVPACCSEIITSLVTAYARTADDLVSVVHSADATALEIYDQHNVPNAPLRRATSEFRPYPTFLAVDATDENIFMGSGNSVISFTWNPATPPNPPISGSNTGLSNPTGGTVTIP